MRSQFESSHLILFELFVKRILLVQIEWHGQILSLSFQDISYLILLCLVFKVCIKINRHFWFNDQFSLNDSPFSKLDKKVFLSGQMCHRKTPGQIRHADKTVPYCQLMGAKSKLRWLYLRKLILRPTGHPLRYILTADFSLTNEIFFASQNPK